MDEKLATAIIRPGEADRILAGHPWVYASSIMKLTAPVEDGAVVQVKDHRHRFLGVGFYNSKSKIQVRLIDIDRVEINQSYFTEKLRTCLALRSRAMPEATSFRLVNAESDFLSGLIVDNYECVLVLQTSSLGMDQRKPEIVAALKEIMTPK